MYVRLWKLSKCSWKWVTFKEHGLSAAWTILTFSKNLSAEVKIASTYWMPAGVFTCAA